MSKKRILVPNILVMVPDKQSTGKTFFVPEYEFPLIKEMWKYHVRDAKTDPIKALRLPAKKVGRRDKYAGLRFREIESPQLEKLRLATKYEKQPKTKSNVFDTVYPGRAFEDRLTELYPKQFPKIKTIDLVEDEIQEMDDPYDDEDDWEEVDDAPSNALPDDIDEDDDQAEQNDGEPENLSAPPRNLEAAPAEAIEELCKLKFVEEDRAAQLYAAGYETISDVAQSDPEEIARAVSGLGGKNSQKVVEHAVSLDLEADED